MKDSQLDQLLHSDGSCHTPSGFSSDVWNRIAAESTSDSWFQAWNAFLSATLARLSQPVGALATCAAFVIVGSLIGLQMRPEAQPPELQYIQFVSPFLHHVDR